MRKNILGVFALSVATISLGACGTAEMNPFTNKPPGVYKNQSQSTSPNGTTTKTNQTTSVYRDAHGDKKAVVKTETTKDPEGLFNKEKTTTYKTYN